VLGTSLGVLALAVGATPAASKASLETTGATPRSVREPPSEISRLPTRNRVVALTIDCGGNAAGVSRMLKVLERMDAPATFFVTGRWVVRYPQRTRRIAARYPMGNHSYSHPDLTRLGAVAVRNEVRHAARVIRSIARRDPRPLFRFPYGSRDTRTLELIAALGYTSILWTVDSLGWRGRSAGVSPGLVVRRVLGALRPGAIVLLHAGGAPDGSVVDAQALPRLVRELRRRGYRLTTVRPYLSTNSSAVAFS
jgi:peptidoglycan/xylan/chitin deacetylase (PgdA/CDA1 family)